MAEISVRLLFGDGSEVPKHRILTLWYDGRDDGRDNVRYELRF